MMQILGKWVKSEDVRPETNIAGRRWMTADGEMFGTFYSVGDIPNAAWVRGILWYFPPLTTKAPG
jgi:hypothetical protein